VTRAVETFSSSPVGGPIGFEKTSSDREQYRKLYMQLLERCKLLERGIIAGKKAERFAADDTEQLSMQLLGMCARARPARR
jgi:hypothetical protein